MAAILLNKIDSSSLSKDEKIEAVHGLFGQQSIDQSIIYLLAKTKNMH